MATRSDYAGHTATTTSWTSWIVSGLLIAFLLRFMDSFMIYTEPFVVTGGGPGNSTTFLSIDLVKTALGQFDLGKAAALSIVYNLIIIIVCWVFYTVMTNAGAERRPAEGSM